MTLENEACTPADFLLLREQAADLPVNRIDSARPLWIFGAGKFGRDLAIAMHAQGITVAGFVETSPGIPKMQGLPVMSWDELAYKAPQAQIALGIFNRNTPYDQLLRIPVNAGFVAPMSMPWMFYEQFSQELGWRFWLSSRSFVLSSMERIADISEKLADQESVQILKRICAFRLGLDISYASFQSKEKQYFNELTLPSLQDKSINYVDCGAYNGDTYRELLRQPGVSCSQAFLLEPDPINYSHLVREISEKNTEAICLPLAAAARHSSLTFDAGLGEASSIVNSNGAGTSITAVALDQLLSQTPIHLLKLDIEGAEAQALRGAQNLIRSSRPVLAVSLYHNPQDLWELPELLVSLCPDYKFYIRQHGFNSFESVLYAIPEPC